MIDQFRLTDPLGVVVEASINDPRATSILSTLGLYGGLGVRVDKQDRLADVVAFRVQGLLHAQRADMPSLVHYAAISVPCKAEPQLGVPRMQIERRATGHAPDCAQRLSFGIYAKSRICAPKRLLIGGFRGCWRARRTRRCCGTD